MVREWRHHYWVRKGHVRNKTMACEYCGLESADLQVLVEPQSHWGICPKHPAIIREKQVTDHVTVPMTEENRIAVLAIRAKTRLIEAEKLVILAGDGLLALQRYSDIYEPLLKQVDELREKFEQLVPPKDSWEHWLGD